MARRLPRTWLAPVAGLLGPGLLLCGCPSAPKTVVYDLARRAAIAERDSACPTLLFGTPAAEPHLTAGFYQEAGGGEGDSFLWAKDEAEVSLNWPAASPRAAVLDLAPYAGVKDQSVEVRLNDSSLGRFTLNDVRHRYRLALPAEAQRAGENRLRFLFAKTASPADADPKSGDKRRLAARFYSLVLGDATDPSLDDLLRRDAPAPFGTLVLPDGTPQLTLIGTASVRYALRLPPGAELRFTPDLHPSARAAGAGVSFRVTLETRPGEERELWSRVIAARDRGPGEVRLALPADAGAIARLGLHVGGQRFAWGTWTAPRILGRSGVAAGVASPDQERRAAELRAALAGSNVVLVILDAARAAEFGCYGYARATTPEIDRIAREGVLFESVATPAVYTLGAMPSIWTSQYPDRHHSELSYAARLPRDRVTLAEVLSARGIKTVGFVANSVAGTAFGFDRGFSEFHETFKEYDSGAAAFRKALPPWLAKHKQERFFAYLHFREPHFPYAPPPPFDTRFGPDAPLSQAQRSEKTWYTDVNQGRVKPTAEEIAHLVRLYDGNLAFADQEVGALRRTLEAQGLWERTILIVAADHGEGLLERGWIGHNVHVFEEATHVPLIVRFPAGKGPSGLRVKGLAELLDLAPTIADVFGVLGEAGVARHFEGRSLLPMVAGGPGKTEVLSRTIWERPIYALKDERFKFIYNTRTGEERLFDLVRDPGEAHDIRDAQPLRTAFYREALHHWTLVLAQRAPVEQEEAPVWTPEQCENMKTLGYVDRCKP